MRKFALLCLLSLTLSSCATEAETRAAMTGAVIGAAVLVDQSTRTPPRHADRRKAHEEHEEHEHED